MIHFIIVLYDHSCRSRMININTKRGKIFHVFIFRFAGGSLPYHPEMDSEKKQENLIRRRQPQHFSDLSLFQLQLNLYRA